MRLDVVMMLATLTVACTHAAVDEGAALATAELPAVQSRIIEQTERTRKVDLRFTDAAGKQTDLFLREPLHAERPLPAVLLLAGLETGRESLDLVDERSDLLLLSMNYPYEGPEALWGLNLVRGLPALRRTAAATLDASRLALAYLAGRADTDPDRIVVVGVSLGSIFATKLAAGDPYADAVVLIYGGGNLGAIARQSIRAPWLPGAVVAFVVRLLFGDLEPLEHVKAISPRYLLMVNSTADEMIPVESVLELYDRAGEPKKLLWYQTGHMDLFDRRVVASIVADVVRELAALGYLDSTEP
jgi:hypothetical protein